MCTGSNTEDILWMNTNCGLSLVDNLRALSNELANFKNPLALLKSSIMHKRQKKEVPIITSTRLVVKANNFHRNKTKKHKRLN